MSDSGGREGGGEQGSIFVKIDPWREKSLLFPMQVTSAGSMAGFWEYGEPGGVFPAQVSSAHPAYC